jgi:hypothetical protein
VNRFMQRRIAHSCYIPLQLWVSKRLFYHCIHPPCVKLDCSGAWCHLCCCPSVSYVLCCNRFCRNTKSRHWTFRTL